MRRSAALLVLAALVAAACSGSGDEATTSEPATSAPTTELASTTGEPSTTTTTGSTTTSSPATTLADDEARLRAAEEAYIDSWEAYHAAILDPSDPDLRAEIERTYTGGNLEGIVETLDGYEEAGLVARAHPEIAARTVVVSPAKGIPGETDRVDMVVCEVNTEVYYELGAAPDGSDSLVRDEIVTLRILARMKIEDGVWRSESGRRLSRLSGDTGCSD